MSDGAPESSSGDSTAIDSDGGCAPSFDITWNHKLPTDGVCTGSGWCWVSPAAPIVSLSQAAYVAAASAGGVLWVGGPDPGKLLRYDGTKWTGLVGAMRPIDIATTGPNDVWILESKNHVWHYDGSVFTEATLPTTFELTTVVAAAPNDAWLVGKSAAVLHWDGTSWKSVDAGIDVSYDVTAAFAAAHNDIWIGASDGKLRHYDGTSWTTRAAPATPTAIWASPGGSKLFVGPSFSSWNGTGWTAMPGRAHGNIVNIAGASADSLLLVQGDGSGMNYYFNGTSLDYSDGSGADVSDVAAFGGKFVLVTAQSSTTVADNGVMETPGTFTVSPDAAKPLIPRAMPAGVTVVPFSAHDALIYTVDKGPYRGDPATKTFASAPGYEPPGSSTHVVLGWSGPNDLWLDGGSGVVRHYDGSWHAIVVNPGGSFVLGEGNGATYAQSGTTLSKFDGSAFVSVSTTAPAAELIAPGVGGEVWSYAPNSFGHPVISRFSGGAWSTMKSSEPPEICANLVSFDAGHAYCLSGGGRLLADGTSVAMTTMNEHFYPLAGAFDRKRGWVRAPAIDPMSPIPTDEMDWFLDTTCGSDHWYATTKGNAFNSGSTSGGIFVAPDGSFLRLEQTELLEWRH